MKKTMFILSLLFIISKAFGAYSALEFKIDENLFEDYNLILSREDINRDIEELYLIPGIHKSRYFTDLTLYKASEKIFINIISKNIGLGFFTKIDPNVVRSYKYELNKKNNKKPNKYSYQYDATQEIVVKKNFTHLIQIGISNFFSTPPSYAPIYNINFNPSPNYDADGDGLGVKEEYENSSDPQNTDTDGDRLDDYLEVHGTNGVVSTFFKTNPIYPDTDDDGISDYNEIYGWSRDSDPPNVVWYTRPDWPDTDMDGIIDSRDPNPRVPNDTVEEDLPPWKDLEQRLKIHEIYASSGDILDPDADTDNDGISNGDEILQGTAPIIPNGEFLARFIPSPIVITSAPCNVVTASFEVINLSYIACTGHVSVCQTIWLEELLAENQRCDLYFDYINSYFCSPFGNPEKYNLIINTENLTNNTIYSSYVNVEIGNTNIQCEVKLYITPGSTPNHAPEMVKLLSPDNNYKSSTVDGQLLCWEYSNDIDNDPLYYEIHWENYKNGIDTNGLYQFIGVIPNLQNNQHVLFDPMSENPSSLISNTVYYWQVVVYDDDGGKNWSPIWTFTTPFKDSDGDGLSDDNEVLYGTDPTVPDSDGDGVLDGEEVKRRSDPMNKADKPVFITTINLENGVAGKNYKTFLRASGGAPPYLWQVESQDGLSVDQTGMITGIPTQVKPYVFEVNLVDRRSDLISTNVTINVKQQGTSGAGKISSGTIGN